MIQVAYTQSDVNDNYLFGMMQAENKTRSNMITVELAISITYNMKQIINHRYKRKQLNINIDIYIELYFLV